MKTINEIKTKIQYENIFKLLEESKFKYKELDNLYPKYLYSIYTCSNFSITSFFLYIGNKGTDLYFLKINSDLFLNITNFSSHCFYSYKIDKNEHYIVNKYEFDKIYDMNMVRSNLYMKKTINKKDVINKDYTLFILFKFRDDFEQMLKGCL